MSRNKTPVRISEILRTGRVIASRVQDALATLSANSAVADAETLLESANNLEALAQKAEQGLVRIHRLIRHLGADSLTEASAVLCRGERPDDARQMMALHATIQGMSTAQAEVALFLQECMDSLSLTRSATAQQSQGGRLIGSA